MLKSFFAFLLIIFLTAVLVVVALILRVIYKVRNHTKNFFRQADDAMNSQRNTTQRNTTQRTSTTPDGETIIDQRDPETANRKIFDKDEGEYVKFKEVE